MTPASTAAILSGSTRRPRAKRGAERIGEFVRVKFLEAASSGTARGLALIFSLLICYLAGIALVDENTVRTGAIGFGVVIVLLSEPLAVKHAGASAFRKAVFWLIDGVLLFGFLFVIYWFLITSERLWDGVFEFETIDIATGYFGLLVMLELTRRTFGLPLAIVAILFLGYALFGQSLPWFFQHAGIDLVEIIRTTWHSFDGVFGRPTGIVAGVVLIFVVFGAVLEETGAGAILLRVAMTVTAGIRGGPAHAAIVASALFGTMSGSVMANVVGTGVFTIPMIKKRGFSPAFAGAVEAAASSGGQVMPPVMAAAAFLMAELTGTPYLTICLAALMPAIFKYLSILAQVYTEAVRLGIESIPKDERETLSRADWIQSLRFVVPIVALMLVLIIGYSPAMAGFVALITAVVVGLAMDGEIRTKPQRLLKPLASGGYQAARIMVAVGAIGIILGVVNETGVAIGFASLLQSVGEGSLFLALVLAMVGSLILGMGLPTLPAYLIIVLIMGPAIVKLGLSVLTVHMFVLYFGVLSSVTPPVALAAYAAAPIAQSRPLETAVQSLRISLVGFLIPFVFAFNPSLLIVESFDAVGFVWVIVRLTAAVWMIATAFAGYDMRGRIGIVLRVARLAAGIVVLFPDPMLEVGAFVACVALYGIDRFRRLPINDRQANA
jgi:TRAP transporter 4TM/12TM fusion protein